jgi:hypothetical protein
MEPDTSTNVQENTNGNGNNTCYVESRNECSTYEKYIGLVEKVLKKSRKNLDTKELIRIAYGEDTTPFGGDEMLAGIVDGILDKLAAADIDNGTVLPQFRDECESKTDPSSSSLSFQQRLNLIDEATMRVINWERELTEAEQRDKSTAQKALSSTLVPTSADISVEDIVVYREYQQKLMVQKQLREQLARIEEEADRLQVDYDTRQSQVHAKLKQLHNVEKKLETAADIVSMGFVQPTSSI